MSGEPNLSDQEGATDRLQDSGAARLPDDTTPSMLSPGRDAGDETSVGPGQSAARSLTGDAPPFARLGHYEIVSRIGHGGMGDVYRGYERALDRSVAIKVLPAELAREEDFIRRFRAEATAAARLIHPNVIQIHFIGEDAGHHFFAMQYVEGESLASLLSRRGKLPVDETLPIVEQALSGLAAAHKQGLIHRDIKPGNILLDRENRRALLADFGLVKSLESSVTGKTATGVIMGTVDYISPEQGRGHTVDGRSDLYSLGVLLYRMLSGRLPFEAENATALIFQHVYEQAPSLKELTPELPSPLVAIVEKLMRKGPADRHQTADEVLADLRAFRAGERLPSGADKRTARQTTIVRVPEFEEAPLLSKALGEVAPQGWWAETKDQALSLFRRHAPEAVKEWQNTQQQVAGAIGEHERRQKRLEQLAREADSVLAELRRQVQEGGAREELERQIADQKEQRGAIELKLRQAIATVQKLRNQRDILNARLKAAGAAIQLEGGRRKRAPLLTLAAAGLVLLAIVVTAFVATRSKPGGQDASLSRPDVPATTAATAPAQPNRASPAAAPGKVESPLLKTEVDSAPLLQSTAGKGAIAVALGGEAADVTLVQADGTVSLWKTATGEVELAISGEASGSRAVATSRHGDFVAVAMNGSAARGRSDRLTVRDVRTGTTTNLAESAERVRPVAVDGKAGALVIILTDITSHWVVKRNLATGAESLRAALSVSPSGPAAADLEKSLVAISGGGRIDVFSLGSEATGVANHTIPLEGAALAFHPNEPLLAVGTKDGRVVFWNLRTRQIVQELRGHEGPVAALAFDPLGRRLAVAGRTDVRLWDLGLGYVRKRLATAGITSLAFDESGKRLVTAGPRSAAAVWNSTCDWLSIDFTSWNGPAAKEPTGPDQTSFASRLPEASKVNREEVVLPGGRTRLVATQQRNPHLEDAATTELIRVFRLEWGAKQFAVAPDGETVAFVEARRGKVGLWEIATGRKRHDFEGAKGALSAAFSPDGRRLLTGSTDTAHLFDVETGKELRRYAIGGFEAHRVFFSRDGREAVATQDGDYHMPQSYRNNATLKALFDVETGELLAQYRHLHPEAIFCDRALLCDTRFGTMVRPVDQWNSSW